MNKKIIFSILLAAVIVTPFITIATPVRPAGSCGDPSGGNEELNRIATNVMNAASTVGAALAVIGFIIAGILWLTAAGSPTKLELAKKALMAAVIGTAILALAQGANILKDIFCMIITTS